ncbi:MBL fold metallo-hydrolase [Thermithiobacillus plumbiphilus]|uniref:MBL fold metallo-hydrolase n=1 Tax=Thermithiobacillus plumbiphilus TaxID=1729899 RepID=A0ABU9DC90_9PROT
MIARIFGRWVMLVLLLTPVLAQAEKLETLPVTRIAPNTYAVYGHIAQLNTQNRGFNGNAGFVVTTDGVVVIDALGTPLLGKRLLASIRKITNKPIRYLILTHNHPDHSYGTSALKDSGATVIAHAGTQDYLHSSDFESSVDYRREIIPQDMREFRAIAPDQAIDGDIFSKQVFRLGKHSFEVYNVDHHHSYGDLVIRQLPENILWIGDLAFNGRTTYIGDGHSGATLKGIDWLRSAFPDAKLMMPGHGKAQRPPFPMLQQTYRYVERLRTKMGQALEAGESLESAVDECDFPDWHKVPLYAENHRRNCSFVYREMEQEVFFAPETP